MKKVILYLILSTFLLSCSEELIDDNYRGTLRGTVRTELDNEPLENVKITTTPPTLTVYTDAQGEFEILESIPMGDYSVKAELKGYVTEVKPLTISAIEQTVSIDFEMITDESLNKPPSTPELLSPENLAVNVPTNVTLKWKSTDPDEDDLTYKVLLNNSRTNTRTEFTDLEADSLYLENLHHATAYTWQVVVSDGINPDVYSNSSQFTTVPNSEFRYHFVRKENANYVIYSTDLDETVKITESTASSWRPLKHNIANKIAFLQTYGGQTHLMTAELNGDNPKKISTVPINGFRNDQLSYSWHREGSRFIFPSFDKLYVVNNDGTGERQIYQTEDGHYITKAAWSYDGSKVALVTNNIDGYEAKVLIISINGDLIDVIFENQDGAVGGLDWSTDGKKLLYTHDVSGYEDHNYRQLDTRIFLYNMNDNSHTDLSNASEKPAGTIDIDPKFSPNDAKVIFTNTSNDGVSERSIFTINIAGPDNREKIISNGEMPDYQ